MQISALSVLIGWERTRFPSCIGCCRLGHVPKPRRASLAIFPIFWNQCQSIPVSRCHTTPQGHKLIITGDVPSSLKILSSVCSSWHTYKHEHFQANRRSLPPSSHHHSAAKNMENQVLCRWVVLDLYFSFRSSALHWMRPVALQFKRKKMGLGWLLFLLEVVRQFSANDN